MKIGDVEPKFKIFTAINARLPTLKIFTDIDAETLDIYYLGAYGERTASNLVNENTIDTVAKVIVGLYGKKWDSLFDTVTEIKKQYLEMGMKTTETYKEDGTNKNTMKTVNEVTGYDSDTYVDNTQDTTTNDGTTTNNYTKTKLFSNPYKTNTENIVGFLDDDSIFKTVFDDINKVATLNIFDVNLDE